MKPSLKLLSLILVMFITQFVSIYDLKTAEAGAKKDKALEAALEQGLKLVDAAGDKLIGRAIDGIFGCDDARSTTIIINNHSSDTFYKVWDEFSSGGFSNDGIENKIEPYSQHTLKVVSHGVLTGVEGKILFDISPGRRKANVLDIRINNPYAGDNTGRALINAPWKVDYTLGTGNCNRFTVDVWCKRKDEKCS
ncbi:MAG: hypothetical protein ETSY1_31990 [Candidatus Entotheonella factor]|uniref:Uncharacterized protein n=1 Tax=Entotheonella factor TaxID=1429438 RepID=W4LBJ6_ENTF1|nr:MAG: hypothetical protein ETSY1_31990 [Candidatus Entotheonella factor]